MHSLPEIRWRKDYPKMLEVKLITSQKPKKKKKLHHSSHIRLIRWTQPVSRDIGEHN